MFELKNYCFKRFRITIRIYRFARNVLLQWFYFKKNRLFFYIFDILEICLIVAILRFLFLCIKIFTGIIMTVIVKCSARKTYEFQKTIRFNIKKKKK